MNTEQKAKQAWQAWGHNWAMFTICSDCKEMRQCRGKTKRRMLCLHCWDQR